MNCPHSRSPAAATTTAVVNKRRRWHVNVTSKAHFQHPDGEVPFQVVEKGRFPPSQKSVIFFWSKKNRSPTRENSVFALLFGIRPQASAHSDPRHARAIRIVTGVWGGIVCYNRPDPYYNYYYIVRYPPCSIFSFPG